MASSDTSVRRDRIREQNERRLDEARPLSNINKYSSRKKSFSQDYSSHLHPNRSNSDGSGAFLNPTFVNTGYGSVGYVNHGMGNSTDDLGAIPSTYFTPAPNTAYSSPGMSYAGTHGSHANVTHPWPDLPSFHHYPGPGGIPVAGNVKHSIPTSAATGAHAVHATSFPIPPLPTDMDGGGTPRTRLGIALMDISPAIRKKMKEDINSLVTNATTSFDALKQETFAIGARFDEAAKKEEEADAMMLKFHGSFVRLMEAFRALPNAEAALKDRRTAVDELNTSRIYQLKAAEYRRTVEACRNELRKNDEKKFQQLTNFYAAFSSIITETLLKPGEELMDGQVVRVNISPGSSSGTGSMIFNAYSSQPSDSGKAIDVNNATPAVNAHQVRDEKANVRTMMSGVQGLTIMSGKGKNPNSMPNPSTEGRPVVAIGNDYHASSSGYDIGRDDRSAHTIDGHSTGMTRVHCFGSTIGPQTSGMDCTGNAWTQGARFDAGQSTGKLPVMNNFMQFNATHPFPESGSGNERKYKSEYNHTKKSKWARDRKGSSSTATSTTSVPAKNGAEKSKGMNFVKESKREASQHGSRQKMTASIPSAGPVEAVHRHDVKDDKSSKTVSVSKDNGVGMSKQQVPKSHELKQKGNKDDKKDEKKETSGPAEVDMRVPNHDDGAVISGIKKSKKQEREPTDTEHRGVDTSAVAFGSKDTVVDATKGTQQAQVSNHSSNIANGFGGSQDKNNDGDNAARNNEDGDTAGLNKKKKKKNKKGKGKGKGKEEAVGMNGAGGDPHATSNSTA